jgi:hypothetical protein
MRELTMRFRVIRQPHVALIVCCSTWRAEPISNCATLAIADPHLVVHALPFHQVAGAVDPRARTHARLVRFAILDRLVRRAAGTPDGRDAEGEPGAAGRLAEVLLQMRVEFHEPRHDGQVRGVDELAGGMRAAGVRRDADDPLPSMTMSTFVRAVALFMSTRFPACTMVRPVGIAGVYFKSTGTVRMSPVSRSMMRSASSD